MEPLFDRQYEAEQHDKRSLYATLQTVYSMDQGEDGTPDTTTNAAIATTATVGEEEGVALNYSTMTRPTSKIQSSLIREGIMSNKDNGMDETCSITNSVFMDDGAATTNESVGSRHLVPQMCISLQKCRSKYQAEVLQMQRRRYIADMLSLSKILPPSCMLS